MKKTPKPSKTPSQGNLIDPPILIDFEKLLNNSKLSENEQGILKRRLIESRDAFGKMLNSLAKVLKQEKGTVDLPQSLKKFEEKEKREIRSFDSITKILSHDFPQLLQFILDEYEVEAENTKALIGKEFIAIKRIADVIFEAKDKKGGEVIIHLEFESEYQSDEKMDKRKLEYRHLMEMDDDFQGKAVLCNVFYLRGSPEDKAMIEDRIIKLPSTDPRYSGELKYKAYHLNLVTIETIINRKLPFLLPFVVESELRGLATSSTSRTKSLKHSLQKQIDEHEVELKEMIDALTDEQMESLRTTIEYLWGRSYRKNVFNKSTLLTLMRKEMSFREKDIQLARRTERREVISAVKLMWQEGKLTQEQLEDLLKRIEHDKK